MCCEEKCNCEHPDRLKGRKPGECPPDQVEECHGKSDKHSCCED